MTCLRQSANSMAHDASEWLESSLPGRESGGQRWQDLALLRLELNIFVPKESREAAAWAEPDHLETRPKCFRISAKFGS